MKYMNIQMAIQLVQILNIITGVITIILGVRYIKYNKINSLLILLPIFSLLQLFISEFIAINRRIINQSSELIQISVTVYSIAEFLIIIIFLYCTEPSNRLRKIILAVSCFLLFTAVLDILSLSEEKQIINLNYFNLFEGLFIITVIILKLINQLRDWPFFETVTNSIWISKFGILLAFLIFWPNSVIIKLVTNSLNEFYNYLFISNSLAYLIFFIFLSFSFYVSRKSRIN